jgi:hypothetical protein
MRRAAVAFAAVCVAGLAALAAVGASRGSDLVYQTGAQVSVPVATLGSGDRTCQSPYLVPHGESFDTVRLSVVTSGRPGAPLRVAVLDDGREIASGRLPGRYPDYAREPRHDVRVGRVQTRDALRICIENEGGPRVGVLGQPGFASPHTRATVNGRPIDDALALSLRTGERSLLAQLPDMARRAAVFRAGWVTPGVYWVLGLLLLVGAPLLLARGIAQAAKEDGDARA